jgi:polysaccharide export outer membrane protein
MRFSLFSFFIAVIFLFSCRSQSTVIRNYLERIDTSGKTVFNMPESRIQKNDLLSIRVYSQSADPRTDLPYNLPEQAISTGAGTSATAGFLVDEKGNIEYPRLGVLKVEGLTRTELAQLIRSRLETELRNPTVNVRFLNYRVTVLGEVRTPGTFTLLTERVTILDALGLAGDITDFGKRDTVKVAREVNGQLQIGFVGLNSSDLFSSPYYRLQQNDVVFVEQTRKRVQQEERQAIAQQVGIATGILTAIALIVNLIR